MPIANSFIRCSNACLLSLGAPCKFLVDNKGTPTAPGCQLQTTSRCWCTNGQHWITEAMYERQKEQREKRAEKLSQRKSQRSSQADN